MIFGLRAMGFWNDERGTNLLDTGAHFYEVYETSDGGHMAVGSIEPQFYAILLEKTGLAGEDLPAQMDRSQWPAMKERMAAIFKTKTRDEWTAIFEGTDACVAPVLNLDEAVAHPHNQARGTFTEVGGIVQPGPAPRFSRTPGGISGPPVPAGTHTEAALTDWGFSADEIGKLRAGGVIA
jgi:alpha-methylacyl-CoA racemase